MLSQQELLKRIMEINKDASLTDAEKASARQDLMSGKWAQEKPAAPAEGEDDKGEAETHVRVQPGPARAL